MYCIWVRNSRMKTCESHMMRTTPNALVIFIFTFWMHWYRQTIQFERNRKKKMNAYYSKFQRKGFYFKVYNFITSFRWSRVPTYNEQIIKWKRTKNVNSYLLVRSVRVSGLLFVSFCYFLFISASFLFCCVHRCAVKSHELHTHTHTYTQTVRHANRQCWS